MTLIIQKPTSGKLVFAKSYVSPLWTPAQISTALWLDAYSASVDGNNVVTSWGDKNNNGIVLTQSNAALRPVKQYAQINNLDVITFSADCMRTANGALNVPVLTVYAVSSHTSLSSTLFGIPQSSLTHVDPYFRFSIWRDAGLGYDLRINGVRTNFPGYSSSLCVISFNSQTGTLERSASTVTTAAGATLTYPNSVPFIIGGNAANSELLTGTWCEFVAIATSPSQNVHNQINGYLHHRWGLQSLLPANHPYKSAAPTI